MIRKIIPTIYASRRLKVIDNKQFSHNNIDLSWVIYAYKPSVSPIVLDVLPVGSQNRSCHEAHHFTNAHARSALLLHIIWSDFAIVVAKTRPSQDQ